MTRDIHTAILILIFALGIFFMRALPFLIFKDGKTPAYITYLGEVLPPAAIAMLVVYCFKGVSLTSYPFGGPEFLAAFITVLSFIWKKNTLLSIIVGTACYMILLQKVFI
ncbi:MAG: AzlD domain-containing protein [Lachnospiraceae bacterium]|nr:AzlD domain-containing protein [Lachnospiraceae bacterium]